jgi:filamentous hemagglutinin
MDNSRIWFAAAGVSLFAVLGLSIERSGPFQSAPQATVQSISRDGTILWSHGHDGPGANAEEHWEKHGSEFPEDRSERDYVREANAFVHHPPPGTLTKHDARGDTLFYQPSTDTFAVMDSRGEPRTFFKPDNGSAYWSRQ